MNAQQIGDILDAFAKRLAVPTARLWSALIRQMYVNAAQDAVEIIAAVGGMLVCRWLYLKAAESAKNNRYDEGPTVVRVLMIISVLILACIVVGNVDEIIGLVANPDYYAIKRLTGLLKP